MAEKTKLKMIDLGNGQLVPDIKVSAKYADELENAYRDRRTYYNYFAQKNGFCVGEPLLDVLENLDKSLKFKKTKFPDKIFDDSRDNLQAVTGEFFDVFLPRKSAEAKKIIAKNHKTFSNKQGDSTVKLEFADDIHETKGFVAHKDGEHFLHLTATLNGRTKGVLTLVHETGHGLDSHMRSKVNCEPKHTSLRHDSICEISSILTERLFVQYLFEKRIFSASDLKNLEQFDENLLLGSIVFVLRENDVLQKLDTLTLPFKKEDVTFLVEKLKDGKKVQLIKGLAEMHDEQMRDGSYYLRYVVGQVVTDVFMDKFKSSNINQKREMLSKFENYLDNSHKLDLDGACKFLLGQNFGKIAQKRIEIEHRKRENTLEAGLR